MEEKEEETRGPVGPVRQPFEVHGSKFGHHPRRDSGQTSAMSITHTMLFLGVSEDPLDGDLPQCVDLLPARRLPKLLGKIQVLLPDMGRQEMLPSRIGAAPLPAGTGLLRRTAVGAPAVFVRGRMAEDLPLETDETVSTFIVSEILGAICILPPFSFCHLCPFLYIFLVGCGAGTAESLCFARQDPSRSFVRLTVVQE